MFESKSSRDEHIRPTLRNWLKGRPFWGVGDVMSCTVGSYGNL